MKKFSLQKTFCFISFLFILSCCVFYGTRFIKLYLENKKIEEIEANTLAKVIRDNNFNSENFKKINDHEYFINNSDNNYLMYSNILWRIIKINEDNSITAISDSSLTSLAYGEALSYETSFANKWLNSSEEEYSGILENQLNMIDIYLQETPACLDIVDKLNNDKCKIKYNDNYISLLSIEDFVNIGNTESYVINGEYFYLNNTNSDNEVWYINESGNITTNKGTDIIGIRPVITIKTNIDYISGNGSIETPYIIEKEFSLFGSYVKLDNDIWRIYQENDNEIRLMLNDYLQVNEEKLQYLYSNKNSSFNDSQSGTIAYYLNNTYLKSLSYKDKIKEVEWSNGYYGSNSNYDYQHALNKTIQSKVALISIGDIRLNNKLDNYFTLTSNKEEGTMMYAINSNQKLFGKAIKNKINVVPTISIDKDLLTKGNGTIESPYEME